MSELILKKISDIVKGQHIPKNELMIKVQPPLIVGRGSIFKCGDKKISRNHATLDWDDDGILITSIHINPTYIKNKEEKKALAKGQSIVLKEGDEFGLMYDEFWFKVMKNSSRLIVDNTTNNSVSPESVENVKSVLKKEESNEPKIIKEGQSNSTSVNDTKEQEDSSVDIDCNQNNERDLQEKNPYVDEDIDMRKIHKFSSHHTRVLPNWILKDKQKKSHQDAQTPTMKVKKTDYSLPKIKNTTAGGSKMHKIVKSPRSPTKKVCIATQYYSKDNDNSDIDLPSDQSKLQHNISEDEDASSKVNDEEGNSKGNDKESNHERNNASAIQAPSSKTRKSCMYGQDCYRNSAEHQRMLAHPGNHDYIPPNTHSDDDEDDRPECEYGINCYRKNLQHKKSHKHTKKPQPRRQAKQVKRRRTEASEDDSEDSYDYEDPFLNDESSDDYQPTDSSDTDMDVLDGEEEDTKRMMKEAKKFTKKLK